MKRNTKSTPGGQASNAKNSGTSKRNSKSGACQQRSDIAKIINGRHGGPCMDEEQGVKYLTAVMPMIIALNGRWRAAIFRWAAEYVPALYEAWGEERISDIANACYDNPKRRMTTDKLSRFLDVTEDEMRTFRLCSIRHKASTERKRKASNRKRKNQRKCELREERGATPRSKSLARTQPWLAMGMSRSNWFKKGQPMPEIEALPVPETTPEAPILDDYGPCNTVEVLDDYGPCIKFTKGASFTPPKVINPNSLPF